MPRTKTVADEVVLDAALAVLGEKGAAEFTLSEIAGKVGLSRATLIQRFGDRDAILRRMAEHEVQATRAYLDSLPVEEGAVGLWRFLDEIIGSMGEGHGFAVRVTIAALEARDPDLRALAGRRYGLVQEAIAARLPQRSDRKEIARMLHAVIAGSTMQWVASEHAHLAKYVRRAVRQAVEQLFPDLS